MATAAILKKGTTIRNSNLGARAGQSLAATLIPGRSFAIRPTVQSLSFTLSAFGSMTTSSPPPPSSSDDDAIPSLADLCDDHVSSPSRLSVVTPGLFFPYGKRSRFHGRIETVRCFESNPMVRTVLSSPGDGRVLVVDGGGSKRVAIMGDQIAQLAVENDWAGVIVNGCVRDSAIINGLDIGVKALGTHPVKSLKTYPGERGVDVNFGGVEFIPGRWVYSDEDGIIIAEEPIHNSKL